jgi:threonine/homoserine/homoserine lactone efflux protein
MLFNFVAFAGAALLLAMAPGPSTAVVLRQTLRSGRRAAFAATVANEVGLLFWALTATLGLSALTAASQDAYDAIRVGGALVLLVLGLQSIRHARSAPSEGADHGLLESADADAWRSFRVGLVTILANPKAAVFAASFLPQFVPAHAPILPTMLALCVIWVVMDASWYVFFAWLISRARAVFLRPRIRRRLEAITGLVLIGFGLRLAVDRA